MSQLHFSEERDFYRSQLLGNILPFWLKFGRDSECGGYTTCLSRDGSVFDYDKVCTWGQGRIIWTFAYLYNDFIQEQQWLDMAMHGIEFMKRFGFDATGRVYYSLTREGVPLAQSRDIFADLFVGAGFAECAQATSQAELLATAKRCIFTVADIVRNPQTNPHRRYLSQTRPMSMLGEHMILLNTVQRLRKLDDDERYGVIAAECLEKIITLHYKEKHHAAFEAVAADGSILPGAMGRWLTPGHMIELGWFLIYEGQYLNNDEVITKGINLIRWGMDWGWDSERGGIITDTDIEGKCLLGPEFLHAPIKHWWAVIEALYANLLAYSVTNDVQFIDDYRKVHEWSFRHFPDEKYGEWYGYLDESGKPVDAQAKGTYRKSCFHIARSFYLCYKEFAKLANQNVSGTEKQTD